MNTFLGHLVDLSRIVIVSSYVVTSEVCLGSQPKLKYTLCIVSVSHLNYKVPEEHLCAQLSSDLSRMTLIITTDSSQHLPRINPSKKGGGLLWLHFF